MGLLLVPASLDPLYSVFKRIKYKIELGVDRAVDNPGLKARVYIAEQYCRGYGIVTAVYISVVVSTAKR